MPVEFFVPIGPEVEENPAALVTRARAILMKAHHQLFDSSPFASIDALITLYVGHRNRAITLLNQAADFGDGFANDLIQRINAHILDEQQLITALASSDKAGILADWLQQSLHAREIIEPVAAAHAEIEGADFVGFDIVTRSDDPCGSKFGPAAGG